ncbi:MAG TPA: hypothetical protein PLS73_13190 [Saprospiraceae bacterium]|nr:hypothetical protein [Saprospiraceae bacterium]
MKYPILLLISFLFLSACDEKDCCLPPETDYLVFGVYRGFCSGPKCIAIFKLSDSQLLEGKLDDYPSQNKYYDGQFELRSNEKFNDAKKLLSQFPIQFLSDSQRVFGIPDAHDQGGVYLEYKYQSIHNFWILDTSIDRLPDAYKAYTELVIETVDKLVQ